MNKPAWLNKKISLKEFFFTDSLIKDLNVHTVCREAKCPNIGECFKKKEAAFMILGNICTRRCKFCGVKKGTPLEIDKTEPEKIKRAVEKLSLKHVVITSVTRDDLSLGGGDFFKEVILRLKELRPLPSIEVLIPDFNGQVEALKKVIEACPDIINHNLETVPRLYNELRQGADYKKSLNILKTVKHINKKIYTKSGIMLGLGEEEKEVLDLLEDLKNVNCDFLSIGQYLSPSRNHYPVKEYIHPKKFLYYKKEALRNDFLHVMSSPYTRSSHNALDYLKIKNLKK